mmetsp:Transcript_79196/g.183761  ORF Transcript_79196/g.183761 Transcript_79196/m.183761 type:complete len:207 (-) Transcript_79196:581-1201(-)
MTCANSMGMRLLPWATLQQLGAPVDQQTQWLACERRCQRSRGHLWLCPRTRQHRPSRVRLGRWLPQRSCCYWRRSCCPSSALGLLVPRAGSWMTTTMRTATRSCRQSTNPLGELRRTCQSLLQGLCTRQLARSLTGAARASVAASTLVADVSMAMSAASVTTNTTSAGARTRRGGARLPALPLLLKTQLVPRRLLMPSRHQRLLRL